MGVGRLEFGEPLLFVFVAGLGDAFGILGSSSGANHERNPQALGNIIIQPELAVFPIEGSICCRKRLGGLLQYYYRQPVL